MNNSGYRSFLDQIPSQNGRQPATEQTADPGFQGEDQLGWATPDSSWLDGILDLEAGDIADGEMEVGDAENVAAVDVDDSWILGDSNLVDDTDEDAADELVDTFDDGSFDSWSDWTDVASDDEKEIDESEIQDDFEDSEFDSGLDGEGQDDDHWQFDGTRHRRPTYTDDSNTDNEVHHWNYSDAAMGREPVEDVPPHVAEVRRLAAQLTEALPAAAVKPKVVARPKNGCVSLAATPHFRKATILMHNGAWPEALGLLTKLKPAYPDDPALAALINEAQLKADLTAEWQDKIQGRRLTVFQEYFLRRSLPILLLLALFVAGLGFYQVFVAPSRNAVSLSKENQNKIEEAQLLFQEGRYEESLALYDEVLAVEPGNIAAQNGRQEARRQLALAAEYTMAMRVAQAGNPDRAVGIFTALLEKSSHYRDVESKIKQLEVALNTQQIFESAESAFRQRRWLDAVRQYEEVQRIDRSYQEELIKERLDEAVYYAGEAVVMTHPTDEIGPKTARQYFRAALSSAQHQEAAEAELAILETYEKGERALRSDDLRKAINLWRSIYDERPQYLGGLLAEQIYNAYLVLAAEALSQGNTDYARNLYQLASEMDVADVSRAQELLRGLETT